MDQRTASRKQISFLSSLQSPILEVQYADQDIEFWRLKYEKIKRKMNEVKEQRKVSRNENVTLQKELKRYSEKIIELERVIHHFNLDTEKDIATPIPIT